MAKLQSTGKGMELLYLIPGSFHWPAGCSACYLDLKTYRLLSPQSSLQKCMWANLTIWSAMCLQHPLTLLVRIAQVVLSNKSDTNKPQAFLREGAATTKAPSCTAAVTRQAAGLMLPPSCSSRLEQFEVSTCSGQ